MFLNYFVIKIQMVLIERTPAEEARSRAHLLASIALGSISKPETTPENEVGLNNVYRMLQGYRAGTLKIGSQQKSIVPLNLQHNLFSQINLEIKPLKKLKRLLEEWFIQENLSSRQKKIGKKPNIFLRNYLKNFFNKNQ